jgi:hypothetical protein
VEELANTLKWILVQNEAWEEKSRNSQKRVESLYDWDKIASSIVVYYDQALGV